MLGLLEVINNGNYVRKQQNPSQIMKIISLQLKNSFLGWEFDEVNFSSNLTLLVGISGAGKTQTIRSIKDLKSICEGVSVNGLEWKLSFHTQLDNYIWEGKFNAIDTYDLYLVEEDFITQKPSIVFEKFSKNDQILIERDENEIVFTQEKTPKLSSNQSALYLFKEEPILQDAISNLKKIIYRDYTTTRLPVELSDLPLNILLDEFDTLDKIKNSHLGTRSKLFLSQQHQLPIFEILKNKFFDVFPQVENLKIEVFKANYAKKANLFFWIKEKGVERWIGEGSIASGMLRAIVHLSDIFLSNDESVILIDEFENSLGINCIDILTEDLIHENKNLQFIATSHHPYIINNIPYEYWKIVTRKSGHIHISNASDYSLGKSKQEAFIQLIKILEKQS
jgi:hypothetical protein